MRLSKQEIKQMFKVFRAVDVDGSGTIALPELLVHIDLERTNFTKRIFSIFDEDKSGEIDFREFVLSLWNYCTLTKSTLDMFAFDLYDKDGSGELDAKEVQKMLQEIYGTNNVKNDFLAKSVEKDIKEVEKAGEPFDIDQFRNFAKSHQALLFPAFQMQSRLQRKVLGYRFWEKNANRRIKFCNGKYVSIANFILMNMSKEKDLDHQVSRFDTRAVKSSKGLGDMNLKSAQEAAGGKNVTKLMEFAGSKAARRQSIARNERKRESMAAPQPIGHVPEQDELPLDTTPSGSSTSKKKRGAHGKYPHPQPKLGLWGSIAQTLGLGSAQRRRTALAQQHLVKEMKTPYQPMQPNDADGTSELGATSGGNANGTVQAGPLFASASGSTAAVGGAENKPPIAAATENGTKSKGKNTGKENLKLAKNAVSATLTMKALKEVNRADPIAAWQNQQENAASALSNHRRRSTLAAGAGTHGEVGGGGVSMVENFSNEQDEVGQTTNQRGRRRASELAAVGVKDSRAAAGYTTVGMADTAATVKAVNKFKSINKRKTFPDR
eukprot:CAMPEP_0174970170 /NCGR_PEP_ID=MMETSP0004_2-20121128/9217_1 /TAXON_ID=420556 /ORGANISM="Ochromonas sp., Strain CCMP1393" /LENGTH=550 /DNA_ID=CAMNT_0016219837 /DNA_START=168 /DNA_END=1820 /DNA_ORIENTATION=-